MGKAYLKRLAAHFSNETAVATPNGKVLGRSPEEGLKKWRDLPEAERKGLDDLGRYEPSKDPAPPKDGLVLKVFARGLEKDEDGAWRPYRNPKAHLSQEPGRDHLWLTRDDVATLLKNARDKGPLAPHLVDRICRRYLIDLVRIGGEGGPRSRENVIEQTIRLDESPREGAYTLTGAATYKTFGEESGVAGKTPRIDTFAIQGRLILDPRANRVTDIQIVALCETGHFDQIGRRNVPLGVAFSLTAAETAADRVRPHSLYHDYFK